MKQIVIISGKGGTGKTIIAASFACLAKNKVIADCDVDAADLHLLLHPDIKETHQFIGGKKAVIDKKRCTQCGKCVEVCRFDAIRRGGVTPPLQFYIDRISCEGCGVCANICPEGAIQMEKSVNGEWYISNTKYGPLVHAKLGIAEENSGKLVTLVRQNAKTIAEKESMDYIIIDGPPGIGCPVIASISGVDLALVATEPTLSGIHDMERVVGVAKHFGIKTACVINKYDINWKNSSRIEDWLRSGNIPVAGKIPFDTIVTKAMVHGIPVVEYSQNLVSREIENIWQRLIKI